MTHNPEKRHRHLSVVRGTPPQTLEIGNSAGYITTPVPRGRLGHILRRPFRTPLRSLRTHDDPCQSNLDRSKGPYARTMAEQPKHIAPPELIQLMLPVPLPCFRPPQGLKPRAHGHYGRPYVSSLSTQCRTPPQHTYRRPPMQDAARPPPTELER